jgi:phytoene dehydrogenase-like protein
LAAAIVLADAGWRVLVLERDRDAGGCIRTAEVTLPGFRHDLYATNMNAFVSSAFMQLYADDLARHGLKFVRAEQSFCSIFEDGDLVGVTTSRDQTLQDIARLSASDARSWVTLTEQFQRIRPVIGDILQAPLPSWRALGAALRSPVTGLKLALGSSGAFVRRHFEHPKIQAMWAAWGMHLDFPPHIAGGALYPFVQCMGVQDKGIQFSQGGADAIIMAMRALLEEKGGEVRCSQSVDAIRVEDNRAVGVAAAGAEFSAERAVIANVTPTALFGRLCNIKSVQSRVAGFRFGPATMMIHLALKELPAWKNKRAREFAYIHIALTLEAMSQCYRDAMSGVLPNEPVLVIAQPTIVDPSRAPQDRHVLSIQVRALPSSLDWDGLKEDYADRIIDIVEKHAPGIKEMILGRSVLSPKDLERHNPNLEGGDSLSGSHHLRQQFMLRPFLGWSRYKTPVKDLYLCGASTWPGAGVGAGSGWILAQLLAQGGV